VKNVADFLDGVDLKDNDVCGKGRRVTRSTLATMYLIVLKI